MILVAGGSGHLGSELVPLISRRGLPLRVLTRDATRTRSLLRSASDIAVGDVRDPRSLDVALQGVEVVVSAITGFGPGGTGPQAVDNEGNRNLIAAAEAAGARRFVMLSMHGASTDHPMHLLRMKHAAELALRASALEWTILRPTVFLELWAGIVGDPIVKSGRTMVFGRGDNPLNFVSVRDVARFVELALMEPGLAGQTIDVGGPVNLTLNELVGAIGAAAGRRASIRRIPIPLMRIARTLLRPIRPDLAGMIEAGIVMDTTDMGLDATPLQRGFPQIQLSTPAKVIRERFGRQPAPRSATPQ